MNFQEASAILRQFGKKHPEIETLDIFGSVAAGDAGPNSDVDIMIKFREGMKPRGLHYFGIMEDLEQELKELMHCPVDLVSKEGVQDAVNRRRFYKSSILETVRPVYDFKKRS